MADDDFVPPVCPTCGTLLGFYCGPDQSLCRDVWHGDASEGEPCDHEWAPSQGAAWNPVCLRCGAPKPVPSEVDRG